MLDSEGVPHQSKMVTEPDTVTDLTMIGDNCELKLMAIGGENKVLRVGDSELYFLTF